MERIVLHASPRHLYRKIAVALAVGLGAGTALLRLQLQAGWVVIALGSLYALFQLRSLGEDQERVVIDDSGIRDSMLPVGVIGWAEVQGASVQRVGSVAVVSLQLREPEPFLRRLPRVRQFIARKALEAGLPGLYLTLVGTDGDPSRIADLINQRAASRTRSNAEHADQPGRRRR
jgi:hypothetical protein